MQGSFGNSEEIPCKSPRIPTESESISSDFGSQIDLSTTSSHIAISTRQRLRFGKTLLNASSYLELNLTRYAVSALHFHRYSAAFQSKSCRAGDILGCDLVYQVPINISTACSYNLMRARKVILQSPMAVS